MNVYNEIISDYSNLQKDDNDSKFAAKIRKVQSMGCVIKSNLRSVRPRTCDSDLMRLNSKSASFDPREVASKFSVSASASAPGSPCLSNEDDIYSLSNNTNNIGHIAILEEAREDETIYRRFYFSLNRSFIGYISVVLLAIATLTNSKLELSPSASGRSSKLSDGPASSPATSKLGPAALTYLTSKFQPILPFVGGIDLRRKDSILDILPASAFDSLTSFDLKNLWGKSKLIYNKPNEDVNKDKTTDVDYEEVKKDFATLKREHLALRKKTDSLPSAIASVDPFVSKDLIGKCTLKDMSDMFQFIMLNNRKSHEDHTFIFSDIARQVTSLIEEFMANNRGMDVLPASTLPIDEEGILNGDIDALAFIAAMRIFAEWRILRQVPEGYRGYAVGMNLGHKDVVQNLAKIEVAAKVWIEERRNFINVESRRLAHQGVSSNNCGDKNIQDQKCVSEDEMKKLTLRSPTLRELLQQEADIDLHDGKLPGLKEKSSAMGLLWVRRQLHYQLAIYANIYGGTFATAYEAVASAYKEVYENYHGWAVQKIFNYSFQAAPEVDEIYKIMNPEYYMKVTIEARSNIFRESNENNFDKAATTFGQEKEPAQSNVKQNNFFVNLGNQITYEWDKLGKNVNKEWGKITTTLSNILNVHKLEHNTNKVILSEEVELLENVINKQNDSDIDFSKMDQVALEKLKEETDSQISEFLEVTKPILKDLAALFDEFNMNDPKKV